MFCAFTCITGHGFPKKGRTKFHTHSRLASLLNLSSAPQHGLLPIYSSSYTKWIFPRLQSRLRTTPLEHIRILLYLVAKPMMFRNSRRRRKFAQHSPLAAPNQIAHRTDSPFPPPPPLLRLSGNTAELCRHNIIIIITALLHQCIIVSASSSAWRGVAWFVATRHTFIHSFMHLENEQTGEGAQLNQIIAQSALEILPIVWFNCRPCIDGTFYRNSIH